tara:strand:+ start:679 stop:1821 length:1143 start_codon:yes stop_codon:yes gene_type:complete
MKKRIIRLSKSCLTTKEKSLVNKVLDKEFLGMGPEVKNFENELKDFFKRDVVCFNSGTAALQVALQSVGIKPNDEVLVPCITYVASFQAISATGAKPIMCDIDENTLQICLKSIKKNITKKTKVIMPVHYSGSVGKLKEINTLAKKRNLRIIEDAAHAFGTKFKNKRIGSFGDITCFSFDGIKNITSGEGGCLVTNDKKVINLAKDIRLLGVSNESNKRYLGHRSWINDVKIQGWRYHMSDINAAIGRAQLKKFNFFSKRRKELCKFYDKQFLNKTKIITFKRNFNEEVPHIYVIRILNLKKREVLRKKLQKLGIQTGIHYIPGYKFTKYKKNKKFFKNTEKIYKEILTLPLHPDLSKKDIKFVCQKLNLVLKTNLKKIK